MRPRDKISGQYLHGCQNGVICGLLLSDSRPENTPVCEKLPK